MERCSPRGASQEPDGDEPGGARRTQAETSGNAMQQVRPHHEEPLLDGNAQSVRYGEIIHDGSGQPDC